MQHILTNLYIKKGPHPKNINRCSRSFFIILLNLLCSFNIILMYVININVIIERYKFSLATLSKLVQNLFLWNCINFLYIHFLLVKYNTIFYLFSKTIFCVVTSINLLFSYNRSGELCFHNLYSRVISEFHTCSVFSLEALAFLFFNRENSTELTRKKIIINKKNSPFSHVLRCITKTPLNYILILKNPRLKSKIRTSMIKHSSSPIFSLGM